ncbi:MAG: hypothetical protein R3Y32_00875 [Bacillota bacterium]
MAKLSIGEKFPNFTVETRKVIYRMARLEGFYRLNLACPRSICEEVADKMISAYNDFLKD